MSITIRGNTKINSRTTVGRYGAAPIVVYSFIVTTNGQACTIGNNVTVYSLSSVLGIGSTLYQDEALTIPTTYSAISDPVQSGGYFVLTGNQITSDPGCD
jgi:hypothetical protein